MSQDNANGYFDSYAANQEEEDYEDYGYNAEHEYDHDQENAYEEDNSMQKLNVSYDQTKITPQQNYGYQQGYAQPYQPSFPNQGPNQAFFQNQGPNQWNNQGQNQWNNQPLNPNQVRAGMMGDPTSLKAIMEGLNGVYIKQKFELIEMVNQGYEAPNKYYVYALDSDGSKKGKKILKCKEKTGYCQRNCVSQECRGIQMKVVNLKSEDEDTVLKMNKECQCTIQCINRPKMEVKLVENDQDQYLGKVTDPWDCCNHCFKIYNKDDEVRYNVKASCLQLGLCCNCPCNACEKVLFQIKDNEGVEHEELKKIGKGCMKNTMGDADNFSVPFPINASWEDKVLIMTVALMIDYRMFESKGKGGRQGE